MATPNEQIQSIMESFNKRGMNNLIDDFNHLKNKGVLPENSLYRNLTQQICEIYGVPFSLKLAESWLQNEVFRRYYSEIP